MDLFTFDTGVPSPDGDAVLVAAMDGWTDAGSGGSAAAKALRDEFGAARIGVFDADQLFDFRDRRPELHIDRGVLGDMTWPELSLDLISPPAGPPLLLLAGAEPDLAWRRFADELIAVAHRFGVRRYLGLGSVPGPIPHTRPVQLVCTENDIDLLERMGRPHEEVVVPASCQVALEKLLGDAGFDTLGLWVRVPHYIAGDYPQAARSLLERLSSHLGTPVDLSVFDDAMDENRSRLDLAASSSDEVTEHVRQLERLYDAEAEAERIVDDADSGITISEEDVPSADELAAEIERFLRGR